MNTDEMYGAILKKDLSYEGLFFTCVKTTGIFCRPTCTARKPKKVNVKFVKSAKDALDMGFRPCKVCKPMLLNGSTPDWIQSLMTEVENSYAKLKDYDIHQMGFHPNRLRRWFLKNHGMTFHAYQRALRIGKAFGTIKHNESDVASAAFDSGYQSLSGFSEAFKRSTGFSPNKSNDRTLISVTRILTPLGPMLAGATEKGICLLEFVDRKMLETELTGLEKLLNARCLPGHSPWFTQLHLELQEYFGGSRKNFELPLVTTGTEFENQAWEVLKSIPYGRTMTYLQQATAMGKRGAVRAIGKANGHNRIAILIPCHRVIGSDGKLIGYGGGLHRKRYLLDLESE